MSFEQTMDDVDGRWPWACASRWTTSGGLLNGVVRLGRAVRAARSLPRHRVTSGLLLLHGKRRNQFLKHFCARASKALQSFVGLVRLQH